MNKDTFCILPFKHLHSTPDGVVRPCCISGIPSKNKTLKNSTIESAFNTKEFKQLRLDLISGKKNKLCSSCWNIEADNLESSRQLWNKNLGFDFKMETDGYVIPDFEYIDVRFSNLCNFKCIMCSHELSSAHWTDKQKSKGIPKVLNIKENFVDELLPYIKNIKYIYFAGGEPLLTPEHFELLDYFYNNNREISLIYNTNLSTLRRPLNDLISMWTQFKDVLVEVSLDGLYDLGESIRVGLNSEKIISNLKTINESSIDYRVSYTIGNYNIFHIYEFISELKELGFGNIESHLNFHNFVHIPAKYSIKYLSSTEKIKARDYILSNIDTIETSRIKNQLLDIIKFLGLRLI